MPRLRTIELPQNPADLGKMRRVLSALADSRTALARLQLEHDLISLSAVAGYLLEQLRSQTPEFPLAALFEAYRESLVMYGESMSKIASAAFAQETAAYGGQGRAD